MRDLLRSSCTGYTFANICSEKYIISEQIIHLLHSEYLDKDEQSFVTVLVKVLHESEFTIECVSTLTVATKIICFIDILTFVKSLNRKISE